ncbi:MAG: hypothetical protein M5U34_13605 [Chloroflexi bacterium]|nr:hypothetical protein [Chloroflexota bacterium]
MFNGLTGSHQHVGNWPGKTVEKKKAFSCATRRNSASLICREPTA